MKKLLVCIGGVGAVAIVVYFSLKDRVEKPILIGENKHTIYFESND